MKWTIEHLPDLQRRLRNAKKRALFWSGNPSFSSRAKGHNSGYRSEKYELAMCDVKNLSALIEEITKKPVKIYDPRAAFQARWFKLMNRKP